VPGKLRNKSFLAAAGQRAAERSALKRTAISLFLQAVAFEQKQLHQSQCSSVKRSLFVDKAWSTVLTFRASSFVDIGAVSAVIVTTVATCELINPLQVIVPRQIGFSNYHLSVAVNISRFDSRVHLGLSLMQRNTLQNGHRILLG